MNELAFTSLFPRIFVQRNATGTIFCYCHKLRNLLSNNEPSYVLDAKFKWVKRIYLFLLSLTSVAIQVTATVQIVFNTIPVSRKLN